MSTLKSIFGQDNLHSNQFTLESPVEISLKVLFSSVYSALILRLVHVLSTTITSLRTQFNDRLRNYAVYEDSTFPLLTYNKPDD